MSEIRVKGIVVDGAPRIVLVKDGGIHLSFELGKAREVALGILEAESEYLWTGDIR